MIRVVVCGAAGKMGSLVCKAVENDSELVLVGAVGQRSAGLSLSQLLNIESKVIISKDVQGCLRESKAEVMVDFTHPSAVMGNVKTALRNGVHVVVGTTGLSEENLKEIEVLTSENGVNAIVAPNFALGAVLMINFCELAAKYFPNVEIIELHHQKKADAPSGTSIKTAEIIAQSRTTIPPSSGEERVKGVRGGRVKDVQIHSLRLPGLNAHQEVIFGGAGQTLSIRHDALTRSCYMPGVLMAIKEVQKRKGLTYGLDKLLIL